MELTTDQRIKGYFAELLAYPRENTREVAKQCAKECKDALGRTGALEELCGSFSSMKLPLLQEVYTSVFDLLPACAPYVGFHLFGETHKRGVFLIQLKALYGEHGFQLKGCELADHFSEVLRFLSLHPDSKMAKELLEDGLIPAVNKAAQGLEEKNHPYQAVLRSLLSYCSRGSSQ